MRRLCFGGSFNPIHFGHLRCSQDVAAACRYDRVVLIPSATPPHKQSSPNLASAEDRLAMARLATEGSPLFEVSDIEIARSRASHLPSYTLDTARELRARGWESIDWLIGADMVRILPQWHRPTELLREVNFVIMARPGWEFDWESLPEEFRHLKANVVEAPLINVSATEIRQRAARGEPIGDFVPAPVEKYIRERGLYGNPPISS